MTIQSVDLFYIYTPGPLYHLYHVYHEVVALVIECVLSDVAGCVNLFPYFSVQN